MPKTSYQYEIVTDDGSNIWVAAERHSENASNKHGRVDLWFYRGRREVGRFYAAQGWTAHENETPTRFIKAGARYGKTFPTDTVPDSVDVSPNLFTLGDAVTHAPTGRRGKLIDESPRPGHVVVNFRWPARGPCEDVAIDELTKPDSFDAERMQGHIEPDDLANHGEENTNAAALYPVPPSNVMVGDEVYDTERQEVAFVHGLHYVGDHIERSGHQFSLRNESGDGWRQFCDDVRFISRDPSLRPKPVSSAELIERTDTPETRASVAPDGSGRSA